MKRSTVLIWLFGAVLLANLPYLWTRLEQAAFAQPTNPVTLTWTTPTNGQVVSGTIPLTVNASSSVGPIVRIEYSRDGQLIGVLTPNPQAPTAFKITKTP